MDFAGGIEKAIRGAQNYLKEKNKKLKIEVEVRTWMKLEEALRVGDRQELCSINFLLLHKPSMQ